MLETNAIVVVGDASLASALELALQAAGLNVILHDPTPGLDDLPLHQAMTLVIDQRVVRPDVAPFIAALRARAWQGLVILMSDDARSLRPALGEAHRVSVLEKPFQAAGLIAALRAHWPRRGVRPPR